jgi:energy-coupling factor transporter ATP-binding protein EcfA2
MANFDFTTLNFSDLEDLFCDLLNEEQGAHSNIRYKTFKDGKDKGIDILYSSDSNEFDHVGQVKHTLYSGFTVMLDGLKKTEVAKARKLNPNKYLFATSLDLTEAQTESIKKLFTPYIKNLGDIYGRKDLNDLLDKHPLVLKNHFKLWLSASAVLDTIINSDLTFRTSDYLKELKKRIRSYVKTPAFEKAQTSLEKNKFIVITGEPGVGKSTLADMLAFLYIQKGYAFTYVQDDIKDIERVLTNSASKQIVYYDDFLGSNDVEINKARGSETALRRIIKRFENQESNVLILTTRSYLLNSAISKSENLARIKIRNKESIVSLEDYALDLKIQLYNNHVEESELAPSLKSFLETREIRNFVVDHPNFFPRSVEYITTEKNVSGYSVEQFRQFIYDNFEHPAEIYAHAYNEQTEKDDKILLNTLISFDKLPTIEELEEAFLSRVNHEIRTNNKEKEFNAFKKSLSRLDGGFISVNTKKNEVAFINPSLVDFLTSHIKQDRDEVKRIIESACLTSQLAKIYLSENSEANMPDSLKERLLNDYLSFVTPTNPDLDLLKIALVIFKKINLKDSEKVICSILEEINDWGGLHKDYSLNLHFRNFMTASISYGKVHKILTDKIWSIVTDLVLGENDLEDTADLLDSLVKDYELNLEDVDTKQIDEHVDTLLTDYIDQEVDSLTEDLYDESEADDKRAEIEELVERFNSLGLNVRQELDEFSIDWHEVAMDNHIRRAMEKDD